MRKIFKWFWNKILLITIIIIFTVFGFQLHDLRLPVLAVHRIPSTVLVKNITEEGRTVSGSGVVYNETGLILTAKHVVENGSLITVEFQNGDVCVAKAWFIDKKNDLAIIKIKPKSKLRPVKFNTNIIIGQPVLIIGSPYGYEFFNSVNVGMISGLYRDVSFFGESWMIQLDIAGNPGNSGCPVYNMRGQCIGILVGIINGADGINLIVPSEAILEFIGEHYSVF